jgi:hypothetical protein
MEGTAVKSTKDSGKNGVKMRENLRLCPLKTVDLPTLKEWFYKT